MIEIDDQKKAISKAVAARLKYYRHIKALSQEQLALQAGLNPAYYGQVERGLKCPTVDTLNKISIVLGIPMSELLSVNAVYNHETDYSHRIQSLLSKIPEDKVEQVLSVLDGIVKLIDS